MRWCTAVSAFGGKADMALASQMSAYDPKRTLTHSDAPSNVLVWVGMRVSPRASVRMRRREFLGILGGAAAWPAALKAQQAEHVRHVGVFSGLEPDDAEAQARTTVFAQALQQLGWAVGHNLVIDTRLVGGDIDRLRRNAAELVALAPDVIFSVGSAAACATATGHSYYPDRVRERSRSGWCWLRTKHGPPRRQYHRLLKFRVQHER